MCLSPIPIKNPNYGLQNKGLNYLKDCDSQYIGVPCGHCPECIRHRQMSYIQRVQMESIDSYQYMLTLTYNQSMIPSVTTSTGYKLRYAEISDIQNMFKRLRKDNLLFYPFRYIGVNELGGKHGRPHFHFLLFFKKSDVGNFNDALTHEQYLWKTILSNWTRNIGERRVPIYVPLCTYKESFRNGEIHRTYDLHLVISRDNTSEDAAAWYCLKYMLKPSDRQVRLQQALHLNLPEDEYSDIWSLIRPRIIKSLGFGLCANVTGHGSARKIVYNEKCVSYLKKCVKDTPSDSPFPFFYNPIDGSNYPLSQFYKSKGDIFSVIDAHTFYYYGDKKYFDKSLSQQLQTIKRYEKNLILVATHDVFDE